jgi:hypothetical protein
MAGSKLMQRFLCEWRGLVEECLASRRILRSHFGILSHLKDQSGNRRREAKKVLGSEADPMAAYFDCLIRDKAVILDGLSGPHYAGFFTGTGKASKQSKYRVLDVL